MAEEDDYKKFDDFIIEASNEVWWHTTVELNCNWKGKEFTVRDSENPKQRDFIWMEGEDQFTSEEMEEIEEYIWSGEIDLSTD